jgi:hypothetical protein
VALAHTGATILTNHLASATPGKGSSTNAPVVQLGPFQQTTKAPVAPVPLSLALASLASNSDYSNSGSSSSTGAVAAAPGGGLYSTGSTVALVKATAASVATNESTEATSAPVTGSPREDLMSWTDSTLLATGSLYLPVAAQGSESPINFAAALYGKAGLPSGLTALTQALQGDEAEGVPSTLVVQAQVESVGAPAPTTSSDDAEEALTTGPGLLTELGSAQAAPEATSSTAAQGTFGSVVEMIQPSAQARAIPWLAAVVLSAAACEIVRRESVRSRRQRERERVSRPVEDWVPLRSTLSFKGST